MSQLIQRHEALSHCDLLEKSNYRILLIQAQAGQGKTVLATQFDDMSDTPFAWTTCTKADVVPRSLFDKIAASLDSILPGFSGQSVLNTVQQQLSIDEFIQIARQCICSELARCDSKVTLVIDDAHLLEESPQSKRLLLGITTDTPDYVRFIFLSRYPLTHNDKPLFDPGKTLGIDSSLLAFNREEIAMLYNNSFGVPVDTSRVNQLLEATEGWVAGLMLLRSSSTVQRLTGADQIKPMGTYFDELMVPVLTPQEQKEMFLLSLLDELPESLLDRLSSHGVVVWIRDMVDKNCFARARKESGGRIFRLHHILQDYLSYMGEKTLSLQERATFLVSTGTACLQDGRVMEGLRYYIKAEAWDSLSKALREHSVPLLAANAHQALMEALSQIPHEIRWGTPWICFAFGATLLALDPGPSAPALQRAITLFQAQGEKEGELHATCFLLNLHILVSGELRAKARLVARAAELFESLEPQMSEALKGSCAQAISLGKAYLDNDLKQAQKYSEIAHRSFNPDQSSINPLLLITRILVHGLAGEVEIALNLLSKYFKQSNSPWVSPTTRFSLSIMQVNYLLMAGHFAAYRRLRAKLKRDSCVPSSGVIPS